ncbi:MAG: hypothetical protein NWE98_06395 [Candidatus Bathyarchaeota archaeon]|nr:hypothetical protein [Candidatus Bathyarchaeota archaeon]
MVDTEELTGKNVIAEGGIVLGEVKGTQVNTSTWQITNLKVKLSNQASDQLGFKKRFRSSTICMPVTLVSAVGDVITLTKSLIELSQNPEITECLE